jgi:hypothetical protein
MPILGLALFLAVVSVASFPCWSYSKRWGYVPCAAAGILLFFVAMIAAGGKSAAGDEVGTRIAPAPPAAAAVVPSPRYILDASKAPIPLLRRPAETPAQTVNAATQAPL